MSLADGFLYCAVSVCPLKPRYPLSFRVPVTGFGGCNGSGKSTIATRILSSINPPPEFVNADVIASQLNPNDVDAVAITASRIMLDRLKALATENANFAFETTLAARSFAPFLRKCQSKGYTVNLTYVWLESTDLAIERVARRVISGGHDIPRDIIIRRFQRGRDNFLNLYSPLANNWVVYNNSQSSTQVVAEKTINLSPIIYQPFIWQQINSKN